MVTRKTAWHLCRPGWIGAVLWGLSLWGGPALALNPALDADQYSHVAWRVSEGFAKGEVTTIAQTTDGYLWLGTLFGLWRFDGVRAVPWQPPAGQSLPDSHIFTLLGARDGTLWIGTWRGLVAWKAGRLSSYPQLPAQAIGSMVEDRAGTVWVATASADPSSPATLCEIRAVDVHCERTATQLGRYSSLHVDTAGRLWAMTTTGIWRLRPGVPEFHALAGEIHASLQSVADDGHGALLIATGGGITRLADGAVESSFATLPVGQPSRLLRDRDGGVWIGTADRGLFHIHNGRMDAFRKSDGLSGETCNWLFEDREGNIWVGTEGGFGRFRNVAAPTFSENQGLASSSVAAILESRDGSIWISTSNGLNRWRNGEITAYRADPGSLFEDKSGRVWIAAHSSIGYLEKGQFVRIEGASSGFVDDIGQDAAGDLWFAHRTLGLLRVTPDLRVQKIPWSKFGAHGAASRLAADPKRHGLWVGFLLGGVAYVIDGEVRAYYSAANGLPEGRVYYLRADDDGTLWVGAERGLSRLKDGSIATLDRSKGLPCDAVDWMINDHAGATWIYTSCGIVRIDRAEMNTWTSALDRRTTAIPKIQATVFDSSDGVMSRESPTSYSPHVGKSSDGRLWFVTLGGVGVIDPRHLPSNALAPPLHIETIVADRETYNISPQVRLPPLVRDLRIDYTALSLTAPEKVLFRYKLEGRDREWQNVGTRRQAFYSDLAPRDYRFRVMASNNSGLWNEQGATLDFTIAPAYWQTTWFRAACLLLFVGLLWLLYQLRLRQITRDFNMTLEARVNERTRIARDLHDTLLQSFQGLLLRFRTVHTLIPIRPGEAQATLETAIDQARQAITEGRNAVQGLRSATLDVNDFNEAIRTLGEELASNPAYSSTVALTLNIEGTPRALQPIVRDELYRIATEALRNAYRHAEASHIEVQLNYRKPSFELRVRDDGKGIDPGFLGDSARPGHYGLRGMRERAQEIGAKFSIWSAPASGTEVELSVPGETAYGAEQRTPGSWLARMFSAMRTWRKP